jgi:hypothetical protein
MNFEEKEIEFLKERFCQKLPSNDDHNRAFRSLPIYPSYFGLVKGVKVSFSPEILQPF